ncbi:MAG: hypothetical protein OHK0052_10650 [Anaerolineales bacterium]
MNRLRPSLVLVLLTLLLSACNLPNQTTDQTPTLDVTRAYETVAARLTEAVSQPSQTPEPSATPQPATATLEPTPEASPSPQPPTATVAAATTIPCDQAAAGNPIDVTIPDDTQMQPGQTFSKTWRLRNAGSCTWTTAYNMVWFSGERMSAPASVPLPAEVKPGQSIDLTVDMVAPLTAGTYQSNWKLRNANGTLFSLGSGEGLPFYVRIVVAQAATASPSPTPSITPTATPGAQASGPATLFPNDQIDLDTNQTNAGGDLAYALNADAAAYLLTPQGSALLSVYGSARPDRAQCSATALASAPLNVNDLALGTYLCYKTDAGRIGWLRLTGFAADTGVLNIEIYTWTLP